MTDDHISAPRAADTALSRRAALGGLASAAMSLALGDARAQASSAPPAQQPSPAPVAPTIPDDPSLVPGVASEAQAARSPFVSIALSPTGVTTGSTFTPLQALSGTITPSDLHFQRHHNGIALIDPAKWQLLLHGLADRPLVLSLEELKRFPSVSRILFIECSGNGRSAYRTPKAEMTAQAVDGLTSQSEWTGVPLATLLREIGARREATWVIAEGGDASKLVRSIPMPKAMDDAMVAWAQNGEPLRPANGFPARLIVPGFEGNMHVKWLRRLKLTAAPAMARDETSKYTDPLPNDTARQFSFAMDVKSLITAPSFPSRLTTRGWWPISGIAWSGRGRITRVEVSTDGGRHWSEAELEGPAQAIAHTRFRHMWNWDGSPAVLVSRATDETGARQPALAEFTQARGTGTDYHFNYVRAWQVQADGRVTFAVPA